MSFQNVTFPAGVSALVVTASMTDTPAPWTLEDVEIVSTTGNGKLRGNPMQLGVPAETAPGSGDLGATLTITGAIRRPSELKVNVRIGGAGTTGSFSTSFRATLA